MQRELMHYPPENPNASAPPILFVHGAWHGAWCWEVHFMPYFAAQGFNCYAVSLRGHGRSEGGLRWARVGQYVGDVAWAADKIHAETGQRPVIVGHSMGGYVTQKYLETHEAPAAVLLASIPVSGTLPFFFRYFIRHPLPFLKTALTFNPYHIVGTSALAGDTFFSDDVRPDVVKRYHARLTGESIVVVFQSALFALPRPARVQQMPMLVIAAVEDRVFKVYEQRRTAHAYGTQAVVVTDVAHDVMLEPRWKESADVIITWLGERF